MGDVHFLAWRAYPIVWLCTALVVLWLARRIAQGNRVAALAKAMIVFGLGLNASITQLNGAVMPVVGMPHDFQPASAMWTAAADKHRLLLLADNVSLYYFSLGDLVLIGGGLILLTCWISRAFITPSRTEGSRRARGTV